jgi:4-amino-4-deoxy-L-arabinose transferase-like glycosyltransferase
MDEIATDVECYKIRPLRKQEPLASTQKEIQKPEEFGQQNYLCKVPPTSQPFYLSSVSFLLLLSAFITVYVLNLNIDLIEVDAAQYGSIGMEMLMNGSWLEVYHRGADYLDKPPLLFWMNATCMALFGVNTIAAKLPGLFALLLSLYALYRFCLIWYHPQLARWAVLMLAGSQAYFLMSNDVKTDGLLSGWIMMALWQASVFIQKNTTGSVLLFSLAIALALMTKGPIGFVLPTAAVFIHLAFTGGLNTLLRPKLLWMIPAVLLLITPMCIGLYEQFDLHPEKEVYGLKGPSGLKFFFWTQSFGRLTGEIYWNNGAPWYFFLLSMLWDFAPWVLVFWPAFIKLLLNREYRKDQKEWMSSALFIVGMLGLSASKYKLPHYVFPLFAGAAIISARFITENHGKALLKSVMSVLAVLFTIVPPMAYVLIFDAPAEARVFSMLLMITVLFYILIEKKAHLALFTGICGFGMIMSIWFYPSLLPFQSSSVAGKYLGEQKSDKQVFFHEVHGHALDFYSKQISLPLGAHEARAGDWLYIDSRAGDSLLKTREWALVKDMPDFKVSRLHAKFLFAKDKENVCERRYLMRKK